MRSAGRCRPSVNAAAVGGEVVLSGSGGYGNATINKSLTVIAAKGTYAALSFAGIEDGLTIGAPNTVVVLRNVAINGSAGGTHGVRVLPTATGSVLHLENVTISNMAGSGLRVEAAASMFVLNSSFRSNLDRRLRSRSERAAPPSTSARRASSRAAATASRSAAGG